MTFQYYLDGKGMSFGHHGAYVFADFVSSPGDELPDIDDHVDLGTPQFKKLFCLPDFGPSSLSSGREPDGSADRDVRVPAHELDDKGSPRGKGEDRRTSVLGSRGRHAG